MGISRLLITRNNVEISVFNERILSSSLAKVIFLMIISKLAYCRKQPRENLRKEFLVFFH